MAKRITGKLPAATLAQRIASMSTFDLMFAARKLAKLSTQSADTACTAVLEALEKRCLAAADFQAFVQEIYS